MDLEIWEWEAAHKKSTEVGSLDEKSMKKGSHGLMGYLGFIFYLQIYLKKIYIILYIYIKK